MIPCCNLVSSSLLNPSPIRVNLVPTIPSTIRVVSAWTSRVEKFVCRLLPSSHLALGRMSVSSWVSPVQVLLKEGSVTIRKQRSHILNIYKSLYCLRSSHQRGTHLLLLSSLFLLLGIGLLKFSSEPQVRTWTFELNLKFSSGSGSGGWPLWRTGSNLVQTWTEPDTWMKFLHDCFHIY